MKTMLYWNANFQIPDSGVQSADVYVVAAEEDGLLKATLYSDVFLLNMIYEKKYELPENTDDLYSYLLSLSEYQNYVRID